MRTSLAARDPESACCQAALLGGLLAVGGRQLDGGLALEVETAAVARLAFRLAKARGDMVPHLVHGGHPYRVTLGAGARLGQAGPGRKTCCRRSWLRGCFLAGGSLTRPEHGYHLEFVGPEEAMAQVASLLSHAGIRVGRDDRRVYVKAAEDIVEFLSVVGATAERLAYEQILLGRDLKNRVQRAVNCETANLSRTVEASERQAAHIESLIASGGLDLLPSEVQYTARLRLEHPYATLADLALMHEPPVSKSAVNHRLRYLLRAAT